jgi:hypothetical protein
MTSIPSYSSNPPTLSTAQEVTDFHPVKNHEPGTELLKSNPSIQHNDKNKMSTNPTVSPNSTLDPIAPTATPQTATSQVQYNAYLRSAQKNSTTDPVRPTNAMALDKKINLKRRAQRKHIHRYDLRLKIKAAKTEDEEFPILQKALQRFIEIILQA